MNPYEDLAQRLEMHARVLDPHKIAGHLSQAKIMREAAMAIYDLSAQLPDARPLTAWQRLCRFVGGW